MSDAHAASMRSIVLCLFECPGNRLSVDLLRWQFPTFFASASTIHPGSLLLCQNAVRIRTVHISTLCTRPAYPNPARFLIITMNVRCFCFLLSAPFLPYGFPSGPQSRVPSIRQERLLFSQSALRAGSRLLTGKYQYYPSAGVHSFDRSASFDMQRIAQRISSIRGGRPQTSKITFPAAAAFQYSPLPDHSDASAGSPSIVFFVPGSEESYPDFSVRRQSLRSGVIRLRSARTG